LGRSQKDWVSGPIQSPDFAVEESLEVTKEVILLRRCCLVFDIIGSVMIHAVEVIASLDKRFFFGRELGKSVTKLFAHGGRVVTEVYGVREPRDGEFDFSIACFDIFWIIGIPRICGISIQGNANLTAILWLELLTIYLHSRAMSKQYVMAHNPALPSTVTLLAFRPIASPARGEESSVVP